MNAESIADIQEPSETVSSGPGQCTFSEGVILAADPQGARAEALRSLRTQLMERHLRLGRRAIALCSPSAGAGTSFMAANLAVAFARAGANTLLIDANMRDPAIQDFIVPARPVAGLAQCLAGNGNCADFIQGNAAPNLSVLYSGGPDAAALDRLSGNSFPALMARCMRDFDLVIADTPPANRHADVLRIAAAAGHALLVLRKHMSFMADADMLIGQLTASRAGVAGIVLNEGP